MKINVIERNGSWVAFEGRGLSGQGNWRGNAAPFIGKQYDVELTLAEVLVWGETMGKGLPPQEKSAWQAQVEGEWSEGVVPLRIGGGICLAEVEGGEHLQVGDPVWLVASKVELYPLSF